ncbi:hypothetical protein [Paraburkholderia acidisoli]|uniref:Uncharacterized protein n=1 Tax=Paraburkholderia acidisoli TaxID=2571748 RepID=A0A7Z2GMY2_9BURK|nr:hypothetical protein [Paraburkholderia acidisoli]QGZ64354.1 hypothetical protein FAZ98_21785 [Paraburkholderia acidisoli]
MPVAFVLRILPPIVFVCGSIAVLFIRGADTRVAFRRRSQRIRFGLEISAIAVVLAAAYAMFH